MAARLGHYTISPGINIATAQKVKLSGIFDAFYNLGATYELTISHTNLLRF